MTLRGYSTILATPQMDATSFGNYITDVDASATASSQSVPSYAGVLLETPPAAQGEQSAPSACADLVRVVGQKPKYPHHHIDVTHTIQARARR